MVVVVEVLVAVSVVIAAMIAFHDANSLLLVSTVVLCRLSSLIGQLYGDRRISHVD